MISVRLIQRISINIFDVLLCAGMLAGYFILFRSSFTSLEKIGYCIGFLISCSIVLGLISYSNDLFFILGLAILIQFIISIIFFSDEIDVVGIWPFLRYAIIRFCIVFALIFVILLGCLIGIGLKISSVYLKNANRLEFARKILIPEELINKLFIDKEE